MEGEQKLLILYASQTGNALDAAERIAREAERRGCPVTLLSIDCFNAVCSIFLSFPITLDFMFLRGFVPKNLDFWIK